MLIGLENQSLNIVETNTALKSEFEQLGLIILLLFCFVSFAVRTEYFECQSEVQKYHDRRTCNVTLRHVRVTIVVMEKQ